MTSFPTPFFCLQFGVMLAMCLNIVFGKCSGVQLCVSRSTDLLYMLHLIHFLPCLLEVCLIWHRHV